jgi:CPA2 family monovalent cation:H+ antiporter-2
LTVSTTVVGWHLIMETASSVLELGALLLGAVVAGWVSRRLGMPAVIGYLVLGIAVSPFTPGYVADRDQLQLLADIGVVLLLFEVGIEVDMWRLRREHGRLAWASPLQVLLTTGISAAVGSPRGQGRRGCYVWVP